MSIKYEGKVAIVTGAGNGLGKSHAIALAARGCKVVVNDLGGAVDGSGGSVSAAEEVASHINASGGEAIADGANVTKPDEVGAMVAAAMEKWGHVDILVNNAGILRDKTFYKMTLEDFKAVIDVHLIGSATCTHAVWPVMRDQNYGRVIFTSSPSGLHGIFGQANYGAAKAGLIGLMNALHLEGAKYSIKVNVLSPSARTRMTEDLGIPEPILEQLTPDAITAAMLYLVSDDAPSRAIVSCAGGGYALAHMVETDGVYLSPDNQTPEEIAKQWGAISSKENVHYYDNSSGPIANFMAKAQGQKN
ncbi:SDR family NAD(P)-dependent oxidoreductase [Hyphococcus flavus]|uniref:SDR family NAD(P)-dependent oxidoreductase n=1 Tax=Hyphococcus flavus TaxID=1866326 RepID=A0AAE9ZKJ1_9PROT|nr:SDR family NAD(P)-dependent oxidoreductase [Hyphococcus flavus]WDI32325.1 SDR family NAD(P)-dependent oxidoreductase [Hyphococcus flavus]